MGIPGQGSKSYLQIGKETTFGTAVAATKRFEIISADISPVIGTIDDPSLNNAASRRAIYQGGLLYRGRFVVRVNYEGLLKLFEGVFGAATDAVVGGETIVYDHTFKEAVTLPSYTIEMIEGDIATGTDQDLVGCKFTSVTIRGKAGQGNDGMVTAEFEVLAKDKVTGQTPAGLTAPSPLPVLFHQASTVTDGSGDAAGNVRVREFEITLTNSLADDRFYLGSVNVDEPVRSDFLEASFLLTQEFQTMSLFAKAKAFTSASPKLLFQHPTTIGTSSKREFELRANSANLVEYGNPIQGYGIILATSRWRAWQDATDLSALVARFRNLETAT